MIADYNVSMERPSAFLYMGGIGWPIFLHITIYIEHIIQSVRIASMFGCILLEMWAFSSVKGVLGLYPQIYSNNKVYILSLKDPASFLIL